MKLGASVANLLWLARARRADVHFAQALARPRETQELWLNAQLAHHAESEFGRMHNFAEIKSPEDYAARVPLSAYEDAESAIERIRRGTPNVLAVGKVTHLAPTSGTSGARKLIPFTRSLQQGFDAALSPWICDLVRQRPAMRWGQAYWSISPNVDGGATEADETDDLVPINLADDSEYLGGAAAWLIRQALAVSASVRLEHDIAQFWHKTRFALLCARDLRLISVWHPSFLDLITAVSEDEWERLLNALDQSGATARERELRSVGRKEWPRWWPHLQVISAWGEQAAKAGFQRLAAHTPSSVLVQAKGLLATEGVVTIPYRSTTPLAVTSHFFEFLDDSGEVLGADALQRGRTYQVIVTNGGGLWRYQLGDIVECTGHLSATPTLHFLGRAGVNSDLRGEKLSEAFVASVLASLFTDEATPGYLALRAWDSTVGGGAGYELLMGPLSERRGDATVSVEPHSQEHDFRLTEIAARLDAALCANPHYAHARRIGQLAQLRVISVSADYASSELAKGDRRLGDIKPQILVPRQHSPQTR